MEYSTRLALTGICVGGGTVMFFLLIQKGGPLSAVPMVLAGGAALMAVAGILFFKEPATDSSNGRRAFPSRIVLASLFSSQIVFVGLLQ